RSRNMRRLVFLTLGLLELLIAAVVILVGCRMPSTDTVDRTFTSAGRVTSRAGVQVRLLRQQVQGLQRLELRQLPRRLRTQTRAVTTLLRSQQVDFETVATLRDALGDVATGLASLAETLDPEAIGKLNNGLNEMAVFLEEKVVPSAALAAEHLDEATE